MKKGKKDREPGPQRGLALILKVSISSENANQRHSAARWGRAGECRSVELPAAAQTELSPGPRAASFEDSGRTGCTQNKLSPFCVYKAH